MLVFTYMFIMVVAINVTFTAILHGCIDFSIDADFAVSLMILLLIYVL